MTKYESLLKKAHKNGAIVYEIDLGTDLPCGKCVGNAIFINNRINEIEKTCVLSEELGHYLKTAGDITDQSRTENIKQELIARRWGCEKLVGMIDIINAHRAGVRNRYELAEYLGVTEKFISDCLSYYKCKYGLCYQIDNYLIYFEPLGVMEMF